MQKIRWIFFDIDDTLWSFSENSARTLRRLYDTTPLLQEAFPDYRLFDEIYHLRNAELWQMYHRGEICSDFLKVERFRYLILKSGVQYDYRLPEVTIGGRLLPGPKDIDALSMLLNDVYLELLPECTGTMPEAIEVLKALSGKYLIGGLSNGFNHVQYCKIYGTELHRYIQRMIVTDEIGIQKPDRRIFDYALRETGATPETALMVGDNPEADIDGAINAGWRAVWFDPYGRDTKPQSPDVPRITNLRQLLDILPVSEG